jgi:hypothetical protein
MDLRLSVQLLRSATSVAAAILDFEMSRPNQSRKLVKKTDNEAIHQD